MKNISCLLVALLLFLHENVIDAGYASRPLQQKNQRLEQTLSPQAIVDSWNENSEINNSIYKKEQAELLARELKKNSNGQAILQNLFEQNLENLSIRMMLLQTAQIAGLRQPELPLAEPYLDIQDDAERLFAQAIMTTPEMTSAIFGLFKKPYVINLDTGNPIFLDQNLKPTRIPTVQEIITKITEKNELDNNAILALQAADKAITLAYQVAGIQAGYDADKQSWFYNSADSQLIVQLNQAQQQIKTILVNKKGTGISTGIVYDQSNIPGYPNLYPIQTYQELEKFIGNHRLHAKSDAQQIIQQCLLAQQSHLPEEKRLSLKADRKKHEKISEFFKHHVPSVEALIKQATDDDSKEMRHEKLNLLSIAAETAYWMANQEYGSYIINTSWNMHPILAKITDLQAKIRQAWVDPKNGALPAVVAAQNRWNTIKAGFYTVGGLAALAGTVAASVYAYKNADALQYKAHEIFVETPIDAINKAGKYAASFLPEGATKAELEELRAAKANKKFEQTKQEVQEKKKIEEKDLKELSNQNTNSTIATAKADQAKAEEKIAELNGKILLANTPGSPLKLSYLEERKLKNEIKEQENLIKKANDTIANPTTSESTGGLFDQVRKSFNPELFNEFKASMPEDEYQKFLKELNSY
ncbi:MAG: hypothetical protein ACXWL2_03310 [Candidatus Chromulinivorax sp.]